MTNANQNTQDLNTKNVDLEDIDENIKNNEKAIQNLEKQVNLYFNKDLEKINLDFISNRHDDYSFLLFNNSEESYELNKDIVFEFREPMYIAYIDIYGRYDLQNLQVYYDNFNPSNYEGFKVQQNAIRANINYFTQRIIIKSSNNQYDNKLKNIAIYGLSLKTFMDAYVEVIGIEQGLKDKLSDIKSKQEAFQVSVNDLRSEVDDLNNKSNKLNEIINKLDDKSKSYIERNKKILNEKKELENDVEKQQSVLSAINKSIGEQREELKKLERDTGLISYDIEDYNKRANKKVLLYSCFTFFIIFIIAFVVYNIYKNVDTLALLWKTEKDISLSVIFFTRLPYVFIVSVIIGSCYKICKILISKIMNIHQQQLDLAKIGIIAKDVSDASANELYLTDEEKFELRTNLKMSMLRKYLSKEIGDDYNYELKPNLLEILKEYVETLNKTKFNENK